MVVFATASIIVASAFFVAVEFSLMAVRRNRLEAAAVSSRAARAALSGQRGAASLPPRAERLPARLQPAHAGADARAHEPLRRSVDSAWPERM